MVEILWKSKGPHLPSQDQELCELRLVDLGSTVTPRFVVRETHASWSSAEQQIRWNGFEEQECRTAAEAKYIYKVRRAWIVDAGFGYSTLAA